MKHINLICFFSFLFASIQGFSQENTTVGENEYSFIGYWSKGQDLKYEVTKGRILTDAKGKIDSIGRKSLLTLTVLDSTDTRYLFDVKYESDFNLMELEVSQSDLKKIVAKSKNLKLQYETDENGGYKELKNIESVQNLYKDVINSVIKSNQGDKRKNEMLERAKSIYTSAEYIKIKAFSEFEMLHFPYGRVYPIDSIITFEDQVPNVLDPSKPLPALGSVKMTLDEEDTSIGYFYYNLSIDENATALLSKKLEEELGLDGSDTGKKESKNLKFTIEDTNTYIFDLSSGTILSYYRERIIATDGITSKVDFLEMNLK